MASVLHESPYHERRLQERRRLSNYLALRGADGVRVSWGGVFGGVLSAVGLLILLTALGVAVGISAVQPGETEGSTLGTGAGIWAGLSLLLALLLGGYVSTRTGAITDRTTGFFEGALVWVVSILLMGYLTTSGIGMLAGGAFKLVGGASQAIGTVMQGSQGIDVSGGVDQMLQKLRDPATARQIASATGMQQSQVESTLNDTAQRVESHRDNPTQAAAEAKQGVSRLLGEMKPQAAKAAWITLAALLLALAAAVFGAMGGRHPASGRHLS
jgi:hypothetical protein